MASRFKPLALNVTGKQGKASSQSQLSSLPLVVCGNYHWNAETLQLDPRESESSHADKLHLVPRALELLRSITKPIAVLSICGPFRSGKSYFLSRLLGSCEIFKIGHTFDACTRGIWMSTTALECDDFVVVFLDTEGMDAVGASETIVTKLLIMNVLLSSYLIYNSQAVPEWSDLEDLSCFSQLSCSIVAQEGVEAEEISNFFPDFLWLVRDQTLQLCADDGTSISPTEYLKGKVLVRSDNPIPTGNDCVVNAILTLFPSIECLMLPRPSADANVLSKILDQEDKLNKEFLSKLEEAKDFILLKICPKRALDSCSVSGPVLAELALQYVDEINGGKRLILENSYLTAAEKGLSDVSRRLVEEYSKEMKDTLSDKLPLEVISDDEFKETLLTIHSSIIAKKVEDLNREITRLLPVEIPDVSVKQSITAIAGRIIEKFKEMVVVLEDNTPSSGETPQFEPQVKGGALLHFVIENHQVSRRECQKLINLKYKQVQKAINAVFVHKKEPVNVVESEWARMEQEYLTESIGPAKHEVLACKRELLENDFRKLKCIPGPPREVKIVGITRSKIKLAWEGLAYNENAVDHYKIEMQTDSEDWTPLPDEFRDNHATIDNLDTNTKYWFRVRAISKWTENHQELCVQGNPSAIVDEQTSVSALKRGTTTISGFVVGSVASPVGATIAMPYLGPLATVGGILAAPFAGSILAYQWYKDKKPCKGEQL